MRGSLASRCEKGGRLWGGSVLQVQFIGWAPGGKGEVGKKGRIMTGSWSTRESEGVVRDHMGGCCIKHNRMYVVYKLASNSPMLANDHVR